MIGAGGAAFPASLSSLFGSVPILAPETVEGAPAEKGAYALFLHLDETVDFVRPGIARGFPAGWYVYAGSARGSGGIRARLRRHFRRAKKRHWHIDDLTCAAKRLHAIALVGGAECAIVARLMELDAFVPALSGFGSSDCRVCPAHLLAWRG